ncbi:unnamed protein product [Linum trigynum]|uniref:Uncharacterized protein n=1 Tax=Linum trigynum TaxID=586398 RepID=A0AAV2CBI4_9ROSI
MAFLHIWLSGLLPRLTTEASSLSTLLLLKHQTRKSSSPKKTMTDFMALMNPQHGSSFSAAAYVSNSSAPGKFLCSIPSKPQYLKNFTDWILDTGASDHITFSLDYLSDYLKVDNIFITLPTGEQI